MATASTDLAQARASVTALPEWRALDAHAARLRPVHLRSLFAEAKGLLVAVDSETATIDLEESRMSISTGDVIEVRRQTITFFKKP